MPENSDNQQQSVQHNQGQYQPAPQQPPQPQQGYGQPQQPAHNFQHPPQYGAPHYPLPKKGFPVWAVLLIVGGVLLVALPVGCLMIAGMAATQSESSSGYSTSKTSSESMEADYLVAAPDIHREYDANEVSADEKYKDKIIILMGVISEIRKDAFGNIIVDVAVDKNRLSFHKVHCTLKDTEITAASSLTKKSSIVLKGRCNGFLLRSVMLEECVVLKSISGSELRKQSKDEQREWLTSIPDVKQFIDKNTE